MSWVASVIALMPVIMTGLLPTGTVPRSRSIAHEHEQRCGPPWIGRDATVAQFGYQAAPRSVRTPSFVPPLHDFSRYGSTLCRRSHRDRAVRDERPGKRAAAEARAC